LFKKAADCRHPGVALEYAKLIWNADKIRNSYQAIRYFAIAAKLNTGDARIRYGIALLWSNFKAERDEGKGILESVIDLEAAPSENLSTAEYHVAKYFYWRAVGNSSDRAAAAKLFRSAADRGNVQAQCKYASLLAAHKINLGDPDDAEHYFEFAAKRGFSKALFKYAEVLWSKPVVRKSGFPTSPCCY
jgi:TPR repeat protein